MSVTFTFNSVTSDTMGVDLRDIQKPPMPPQIAKNINIPKVPGLYQSDKKFSSNDIVVKCYILGTSRANLITKLEALGAYLYTDEDANLTFSDQTDRYWNAQFLKTKIVEYNYRISFYDIIFTCNDPFAYDNTADSDDQEITVNDDTYIIANSGHFYARPVITITFNQAQTHIYVANNGIDDNRIDITKSFEAADELEIDCKNETIKLNGVYSPAGLGDGGEELAEWILLAKGNNDIQVGTDNDTIDIDINITFEKVYFY